MQRVNFRNVWVLLGIAATLASASSTRSVADEQSRIQNRTTKRVPATDEDNLILAQALACKDLKCVQTIGLPVQAQAGAVFGDIAALMGPEIVQKCAGPIQLGVRQGIVCLRALVPEEKSQVAQADQSYRKGDRVVDLVAAKKMPLSVALAILKVCGQPTGSDFYDSCAGRVLASGQESFEKVANRLNIADALFRRGGMLLAQCVNSRHFGDCNSSQWETAYHQAYDSHRDGMKWAFTSKYGTQGVAGGAGIPGSPPDGVAGAGAHPATSGDGPEGPVTTQGSTSKDQGIEDEKQTQGGNGNAILGAAGGRSGDKNGSDSRYATQVGQGVVALPPDNAVRKRETDNFLEDQCMNEFPLKQKQGLTRDSAISSAGFTNWACQKIKNADLMAFQNGLMPLMNQLSTSSYTEMMRGTLINSMIQAHRKLIFSTFGENEIKTQLQSCRRDKPEDGDFIVQGIRQLVAQPFKTEEKASLEKTLTPAYRKQMIDAAETAKAFAEQAKNYCHPKMNLLAAGATAEAREKYRLISSHAEEECARERLKIGKTFSAFPFLAGYVSPTATIPIEENMASIDAVLAVKGDDAKLSKLMEVQLRPNVKQALMDTIAQACKMDWDDLAAMPSLADTVAKANPEFERLSKCARLSAANSKEAHHVAVQVGLTGLCFVGGVLTAGTTSAVACGLMIAGAGGVEAESIRRDRNWTQMCLLEGGTACKAEDYEKVRGEYENALHEVVTTAALGVAGELGGVVVGGAYKSLWASSGLSRDQLRQYTVRILNLKPGLRAGSPAARAEFAKIEQELAKFATDESVSSGSRVVANFDRASVPQAQLDHEAAVLAPHEAEVEKEALANAAARQSRTSMPEVTHEAILPPPGSSPAVSAQNPKLPKPPRLPSIDDVSPEEHVGSPLWSYEKSVDEKILSPPPPASTVRPGARGAARPAPASASAANAPTVAPPARSAAKKVAEHSPPISEALDHVDEISVNFSEEPSAISGVGSPPKSSADAAKVKSTVPPLTRVGKLPQSPPSEVAAIDSNFAAFTMTTPDGLSAHYPSVKVRYTEADLGLGNTAAGQLQQANEILKHHLLPGETILSPLKAIGSGGNSLAFEYKVLDLRTGKPVEKILLIPNLVDLKAVKGGLSSIDMNTSLRLGQSRAAENRGVATVENLEIIADGRGHVGVIGNKVDGPTLSEYVKANKQVPPDFGDTIVGLAQVERDNAASISYNNMVNSSGTIKLRRTYKESYIPHLTEQDKIDIMERPHIAWVLPPHILADATAAQASRGKSIADYLKGLLKDPTKGEEVEEILMKATHIDCYVDSPALRVFDRPDMQMPPWFKSELEQARAKGVTRYQFVRDFTTKRENAEKIKEILNLNIKLVGDSNIRISATRGSVLVDP